MKQHEARRIVWERLAATAANDADLSDWMHDNAEVEADVRRLEKACHQVSRTIERRFLKRATHRVSTDTEPK